MVPHHLFHVGSLKRDGRLPLCAGGLSRLIGPKSGKGFTPLENLTRGVFGGTKRSPTRRTYSLTGFTLVELLVVLGIITVIMGVVLVGQNSFNRSLILANTNYDVALTIRSAETFGIASRASLASPNTPYGVHFDAASPNSFILFADTNPPAACNTPGCTPPGDHVYTAGSDTLVQTYTLGNGITIRDFCLYLAGAGWTCKSGGTVSSLDIAFSRPNPVGYLSRNGAYESALNDHACLLLSAPDGTTRSLLVWAMGDINTNPTYPCP